MSFHPLNTEKKAPANAVHEQENWRQRIESEKKSRDEWRSNWGYLESNKSQNALDENNTTIADLGHTMARSGPMYDYLHSQHVERELKATRAKTRELRGKTSGRNSPRSNQSSPLGRTGHLIISRSNSRTNSPSYSSLKSSPRSVRSPLSLNSSFDSTSSNSSYRSAQNSPDPFDKTTFKAQPRGPAPKGPALFLDSHTSLQMMSRGLHDVGSSTTSQGVDPVVKYRFPATTSQTVGWRAKQSVEFFGVNHAGIKNMGPERLYGVCTMPL